MATDEQEATIDLTEQQVKFLSKYLPKIPLAFGKKKKKEQRDEIVHDFKKYAARRDQLLLEANKLPQDNFYRLEADKKFSQLDNVLKGNGKTLDFVGANNLLDTIEDVIQGALELLHATPKTDTLKQDKERIAEDARIGLRVTNVQEARPAFDEVRPSLRYRSKEVKDEFEKLSTDLEEAFQQALKDVTTYLKTVVDNNKVKLKEFKQEVDGIQADFGDVVRDTLKQLDVLSKAPVRTTQDRQTFLKDHGTEPEVQREAKRNTRAADELKMLTAAVKKLNAQIDKLKKARADEKNLAEKKEIEKKYDALNLQYEMLEARRGQIEQFAQDGDKRIDALLLAAEKTKSLGDAADAMDRALKNDQWSDDPVFAGLATAVASPQFVPVTDGDALEQHNETLRAQFKRSSERVIRTDRMYPDEPEVTEISSRQFDTLEKLLDVARKLIDKQEFAFATAAHRDAEAMWAEFILARKTTLPTPTPPPNTPEKSLKIRLSLLEPRILDLKARGEKTADALLKRRTELLDQVDQEAVAQTPDWPGLEKELEQLIAKVDHADNSLPKSRESEATKSAAKVSNKVNAALVDLYRTKPIDDPSKIEDPMKDYGPEGMPKDVIPLDQVITVVGDDGEITHHRIRTRETGGKDLDRREDKDIPREMIAHLRSRGEALALMSQTLTADGDELIKAYAKETEELLAAVTSKEGRTIYAEIEKILEQIKDDLAKSDLKKFIPSGLPVQQKLLEEFKKKYPTKFPKEAQQEAQTLAKSFETLKDNAKKLRKTYEELRGKLSSIHMQLSSTLSQTGMVEDGFEIGERMARLFNGGGSELANRLIKNAQNLSNDEQQKAIAALDAILIAEAGMQKQVKAKTAAADDLEGPWRETLMSAVRMIEEKSEAAITSAAKSADELIQEIKDFHKQLDDIETPKSPAELVKFLESLAQRLREGAAGAETATTQQQEWQKRKDDVKKLLEEIKPLYKDRTNKEELESRYKGLSARYESINAQVKDFGDRKWGVEQLDSLLGDLARLKQDAGGDTKLKGQSISKVTLGPRVAAVANWLTKLGEAAAWAAKEIDNRADQNDRQQLATQITATKDTLGKVVEKLPDIKRLEKLCQEIDDKKNDTNDDHQAKLQRREAALAELHRIRNAIERHPAVEVYRTNPFDSGKALSLLQGAFHRTEVGILVSVDPRAG
jgi:DNA repair exonuclease SbcCD ATPase subunit